MDHLDDLKDKAEEAEKAVAAGELQKDAGIKDVYAGLKTAAEGIGEAHEGISGSLEEYEDEANTTVDEGIAAAQKHPDLATQKMVKMLQRQQVAPCRRARHAAAHTGLAGGEARVRVVKALDDGQAFFQARNPVALGQCGNGKRGQGGCGHRRLGEGR